jgi:DNA-binding NarL/FixJ family response regulator
MATVLLVDYPLAVRQALSARLAVEQDLTVIGEADDAQQALSLAETIRPDIVLLDAETPGLDVVGLARALADHKGGSAIVVLTLHAAALTDALKHTPATVVGKHEGMAALLRSIRAAAQPQSSSQPTFDPTP